MKKYIIAVSIMLLLPFLASSVSAQHDHSGQQAGQQMGGMEGGMMSMMHDMMGQMMNDPIKRSGMFIQIIPTMKEALELTDAQLASLQEAKKSYETELQALEEKARKSEADLEALLQAEKADPSAVKVAMLEAAEHRVNIRALTYETAIRMRSQLSEEQRVSLDEMEPMQLHHHMMTRMTMMEMMQVMHGEGMMDTGMMQGQMSMGMNR